MKIEDLNMSARTTTALMFNGILSTEDISKLTIDDVMKFRKFGRMSLQELLSKMKELNISFIS